MGVVTAVALPSARSTARSASAWTAQQKHHLETRVSSLPRKVAVSLSTKEMEIAMMKITTLDATGTVVTAVAIKSKKLTAKCACASTAPSSRNARRKERPADLVLTKVMATAMMLTISVVVTGTAATAVAPRLRRNAAKYANAWTRITRLQHAVHLLTKAMAIAMTRTTIKTVHMMAVTAVVW